MSAEAFQALCDHVRGGSNVALSLSQTGDAMTVTVTRHCSPQEYRVPFSEIGTPKGARRVLEQLARATAVFSTDDAGGAPVDPPIVADAATDVENEAVAEVVTEGDQSSGGLAPAPPTAEPAAAVAATAADQTVAADGSSPSETSPTETIAEPAVGTAASQ